jgi:hypothetical protein
VGGEVAWSLPLGSQSGRGVGQRGLSAVGVRMRPSATLPQPELTSSKETSEIPRCCPSSDDFLLRPFDPGELLRLTAQAFDRG